MKQEDRGNDAPFILNAVERAIIRVPRSSHHGLTKIPAAVNIAGKTYLDLARLTDIDTRQLPQVVLAARLFHLTHTHRAMVITGQCALWVHGYGSDPVLPPITVATRSSIRPISIPSTTIGPHSFPSVTVKPTHVHHLPRADNARGLLIENLEAAQITVARTSPNQRAAFAQICVIGNAFTHFDNFRLRDSRRHEKYWKELLSAELTRLGNGARGRSQAQWIITHADAGCASPGEARVLYELCAADLTGMRTQVEVHTRGRRYFIDCAFPAEKVGIEFDGRAKYGDNARSIHSSLSRERERQRHLEAEGWHIIRVGWHDLEHPDELIAQVRAALAARLG
jgi:hypothetical protein